jgi:hypothetical protein
MLYAACRSLSKKLSLSVEKTEPKENPSSVVVTLDVSSRMAHRLPIQSNRMRLIADLYDYKQDIEAIRSSSGG